ncbi:MAG TPA: hypothetical protein VHX14_22690 [Thermoanaerobaculia bacterium]|jgi:hypothetical protein|nr:hypothetical protein [Thermoanaerobaculia bacterium]
MIGLVITLVLFPLVGWSVARRSWGEAFLFGVGLLGTILFLAGVVHVPLVLGFALLLIASIGGAVWTYRKYKGDTPHPTPHTPLPTILMAIPLIVLAFIAAVTPLNDFDGRAFWVLKAKGIAHERSIDGPFFQGATLDPRNQYPILIPIDGAVIFALSHSLDDRQVRWLYAGLLAALALLVRERIANLISPAIGAWCAALLVWIPQFAIATEGGALSAYNDIAIAAFAAGAFFELVDAVARSRSFAVSRSSIGEKDRETSQPRDLATADYREIRFGLWLAFLILTKSEGLPFALVFLVIGAFVFRKRIATPAIFAIIAAVALLVWRGRIPVGDEENFVRMLPTIPEKLDHLRAALTAFPQHMIAFSSWGIFWIAVIIAGAFAIRVDRRAATIAIAVIVSMLAIYCGVYVATEWVVTDLIAVTANRLLMHLAAPALFLLALASQWWTRTKSM